jgi:sugar phosphate isomerase/epimerase
VLQALDYLEFIDIYRERIEIFHVKDAGYDFEGWAVVEWECCLKHPEDGAREGAQFVRDHIIRVTEKAFDDFAGGGSDEAANRRMLGID